MNIHSDREFREALGIKEDLDYLIERLEEIKTQDYIDIDSLKKSRDKAEGDLKKYREEQKARCEDLKIGNIIRISLSDGISYSQYDYYLIKKIGVTNIEADLISVEVGDYGRSIKKETSYKVKKEDFIETYNRNYHKLVDDLQEWYELEKYLEGIPFKG